MSKLRKLWILAIPIALLLWLGYALWPRPFDLYVSPPIGENKVRVSFLIPRGWHILSESSEANFMGRGRLLDLVPPGRPPWWPQFLKRMFPPLDPVKNRFVAEVLPTPEAKMGLKVIEDMSRRGAWRSGFSLACDFRPLDQKSAVFFTCQREDQNALRSSLARTVESFRVLPPDSHAK